MATLKPAVNTIAPISNVARITDLVSRLVERDPTLPGFGLFHGKAGRGKSFAATYAINKFRAHYVECDETWTRKAFCEAVMVEIGLLSPRAPLNMPIYRAVELIGSYFADNPRRPLIIDEADFLVRRRMIEVVRAIYKYCAAAGASIVLIGEDAMPGLLKAWERVDSRVLKAVKAEALTTSDVAVLAGLVLPGLPVTEDACDRIRRETHGSARRAVTRLYDLREAAGVAGWDRIDTAQIEETA